MTATPQLDSSIAGRYTKIISDAWYMDHKDTERLLDILKEMEAEVAEVEWERCETSLSMGSMKKPL